MTRLELRGAIKVLGQRAVLDGVDLTLTRGDRLVLLGPSGAGKSTLLSVLGGIASLDAGTLLVDGRPFAGFSADEGARYRNRNVGFVFQRHCLLDQYSLLDNLLVPVLRKGDPLKSMRAQLRDWLAQAGLGDRADARPHEVSVGEAQRAAILRALVNNPDVVLADEPTGSLDQATARTTLDFLLGRVAATGAALVLVTHDPQVAERMGAEGGRCLVLADGRLHDPA